MSHHFDTKLAKEDTSLNLCDFYLFDGPSGKTVMAMTVNPDVGLSAPDSQLSTANGWSRSYAQECSPVRRARSQDSEP
jgi:hypothetical protein